MRTTPIFFGQLESFRGFAALFVAWFHSSITNIDRPLLIRPGTIYVDFFFVLSGFVMMHAYANKIGQGMSFYKFAVLRLARIWPLHIFMLGVFVIYGFAQIAIGGDPEPRNTVAAIIANIFLVHSLGVLDGLSWNYPSWSISVEYFTYLIFFWILYGFYSKRYLASAITSALSFCVMFALSWALGKPTILASYDYGIFRCIASFFAGTAIYGLYMLRPMNLAPITMTAIEFVAVAVSLTLAVHSVDSKIFQLTTIISFVFLIYVFAPGGGAISQILNLPPFRFLGRISFSIYMTHAIIVAIGGYVARIVFGLQKVSSEGGRTILQTDYAVLINLCILAVVVAVSSVTYVYVERNGQTLMKRLLLSRQR